MSSLQAIKGLNPKTNFDASKLKQKKQPGKEQQNIFQKADAQSEKLEKLQEKQLEKEIIVKEAEVEKLKQLLEKTQIENKKDNFKDLGKEMLDVPKSIGEALFGSDKNDKKPGENKKGLIKEMTDVPKKVLNDIF